MSAASLNISPYLPQFNVGNRGFVDTVFGSKRYPHFAGSKTLAYLAHLISSYRRIAKFSLSRFGLQVCKGRRAINPKQMCPRAPAGVIVDRFDGNAISAANLPLRYTGDVVTAEGQDLIVSKAGVGVFRSSGAGMIAAPFRFLVDHVFSMRSEKKVRGVNAGRVVASMKDVGSARDEAISLFISEAMRQSFMAMPRKHAIALIVFVGRPVPTLMRGTATDLTPKSIIQHLTRLFVFPVEVKR